jgi:hypothetical protein
MIDLNKICKRTDYITGGYYIYEGDIIQLLLSNIKNYPCGYYTFYTEKCDPHLYIKVVNTDKDYFALEVLVDGTPYTKYDEGTILPMAFLTHTEIYDVKIISNVFADFINKSKSRRKDSI